HRLRAAYTLDYGRHRQTGESVRLTPAGDPLHVFSGHKNGGSIDDAVRAIDGSLFQKRDRASIAKLEQFALEYRGDFFNDAVTVNIGARAPKFTRELNQYCYTQDGRSTVRCTNETPSAVLAN